MGIDAWLPVGYETASGERAGRVLSAGEDWQVCEAAGGGRLLVAKRVLADRWESLGLLEAGMASPFDFAGERYASLYSGSGYALCPVAGCASPESKNEALAFASALRATRAVDSESPLQDAVFVERLSRLLPTFTISPRVPDDVVFGAWFTGGVPVSIESFRRVRSLAPWLGARHLKDVIIGAGFSVGEVVMDLPEESSKAEADTHSEAPVPEAGPVARKKFELAGRPELEAFFLEHVVDIVENASRYKALGIDFPSAVILHGPPGCGKTFAVERLVDYLGWPSFQIEASSVASPYIHETSKKVAEVFDKAMQNAPSVLVIDEMEAFLADRESGGGGSHHRVEEVAEFLRRIPEAISNRVLIVAMTNRIEMIDPAILRRGRFDHVVKVDMASEEEVRDLLGKLLAELPCEEGVDAAPLAKSLSGRPLSDVAFAIREGARLAARAGKDCLTQEHLLAAMGENAAREGGSSRKIGFI